MSILLKPNPYVWRPDAPRTNLILTGRSPRRFRDNSGKLATRGSLGVNTTSAVGFDIIGSGTGSGFSGTAYATLTTSGDSRSRLYTINLATGAATLIGDINYNRPLIGISGVP